MVNKLKAIAEGWSKSLGLVKVSEENKELAKKRVAICVVCPYSEEMWLKKFIDGMLKNDEVGSGIGCKLCGCPINEKALVPDEKCKDNRW
jgi:hypothetical protein